MTNNALRLGRAIALSLLFCVTVFSLAGTGRHPNPAWTAVHSWAGALMLIGSAVHLFSHRAWIKTVLSKPAQTLPTRARQNRNTDLGLFITGTLCAVTAAAWFLTPAWDAMNRLHSLSGLFMILLTGVHLLLHWPWLVHTVRQLGQAKTGRRTRPLEQTGD